MHVPRRIEFLIAAVFARRLGALGTAALTGRIRIIPHAAESIPDTRSF